MKKLLYIVLCVLLLFSLINANAFYEVKVNNVMNNFYSKLDNSISDIENRIIKLEKINNKIEEIKKTKGDKISDNNKEILNLVKISIEKRVDYYNLLLEKNFDNIMFELLDQELQNVKDNILNKIKQAKTIGDLFNLQESINIYCQEVYDKTKDFEKEKECKDNLLKKLRITGDKIKEEVISGLSDYKDGNKFNRIYQLHAILSAGENAKGEGTFFSTENIAWARAELKKIADERLLLQVDNLASLSGKELQKKAGDLLLLIKAFETASGKEGKYISNQMIKEAKEKIGKYIKK